MSDQAKQQSHVGIPRILLSSFEENGHLFQHRIGFKDSLFPISAAKAGRERGYYDSETELLLSQFETSISQVLQKLAKTETALDFIGYLFESKPFIESFVKMQMGRSKKSLDEVNEFSEYAKITGKSFTHSAYLQALSHASRNPLEIINGPISIRLLHSQSVHGFITNSLGLSLMESPRQRTNFEYIIPLNPFVAVRLFNALDDEMNYSHFECDEERTAFINHKCCVFEKIRGNGWLYGKDKESLIPFLAE